ncbi:Methyltransferase domain protein [Rubripirellula tenax]|uniref:Methyltransferase domain protein n=2 Tax=Rubripirellula tenax TaxID=2528015 RepID=A0A5C6EGG8_9BACT|nr:Methyltransferase domain protein [Rubripirellula tenax]
MGIQHLKELYSKTSKHSNYQVLSSRLRDLIGTGDLSVNSRSELPRLSYIAQRVDVAGKSICDIGGNTGFFTFELLDRGAKEALYFEGNVHHANFVREATAELQLLDRVQVKNQYFTFDDNSTCLEMRVDVLLLLNVLHHVGDDYGDQSMVMQRALEQIKESLLNIRDCAKTLIFQLGFNWKGNRELPLFKNGTKREMIDFIRSATAGVWNVDHIGIPTRKSGGIVYEDLSEQNIARDDSLGEFLNRPLFLLSRC